VSQPLGVHMCCYLYTRLFTVYCVSELASLLCVYTASAPDMGQLQSSSDSDISFTSPATDAVLSFASPANRAAPMATVMSLNSSHTFPSAPSVQPTPLRSEQPTPVTADPAVALRGSSVPQAAYFPVAVHWFYCRNIELRQIWQPFSVMDSVNLESSYQSICSGNSALHVKFFLFSIKLFVKS